MKEQHQEEKAPVSESKVETKSNGNGQVKAPGSPSLLALPAGFNCSPILRDPKGGRGPSTYPVFVSGTFPAGTALATSNNVNLCYIPFNSFLASFTIVTSAVTGTLQDSLATPTAYCTLAGAVVNTGSMTAAQAQNLGTMYCSTPRAIGASGCRVVQWQPGLMLQIIVGAGITPATPLSFMLEWASVYDGGV